MSNQEKEDLQEQQEAQTNEVKDEETIIEEPVEELEESEEDDSNKKLEDKDKLASEYLDKLQRTMAEFDNFRKRTVKEKAQMYENGAKETLEVLLPIIDNFERAFDSCDEEAKESSFVKGIEMIYKQLISALEDIGVSEIEAEGNDFDPNLHNAVTHVEDENYGENQVVEVFQKGYMYKESVLRYSMVKVAN